MTSPLERLESITAGTMTIPDMDKMVTAPTRILMVRDIMGFSIGHTAVTPIRANPMKASHSGDVYILYRRWVRPSAV